MAKMVMLDAGHGGSDYGAVYQSRKEKEDTLALANEVGRILRDHGLETGYTRTGDQYLTPFERAKLANDADADVFVSLHRNAFPQPGMTSGVESYVYETGGLAEEIADAVNRNMEALGFTNLGVSERPNIIVLKRTEMPAVLVQAGYIDAEEDNALFEGALEDIAFAVAEGIMSGLGVETSDGDTPTGETAESGVIESSEEDAGAPTRLDTDTLMQPDAGAPMRSDADTPMQPDAGAPMRSDAGTPMRLGVGRQNERRPAATYSVQTGLFQIAANAERLRRELASEGFASRVVFEDGYYKVLTGSFRDIEAAAAMEQKLRDYGYATLVVKR